MNAEEQTKQRINKRYRALLPELLEEARRCDKFFKGLSPREELKQSRKSRGELV